MKEPPACSRSMDGPNLLSRLSSLLRTALDLRSFAIFSCVCWSPRRSVKVRCVPFCSSLLFSVVVRARPSACHHRFLMRSRKVRPVIKTEADACLWLLLGVPAPVPLLFLPLLESARGGATFLSWRQRSILSGVCHVVILYLNFYNEIKKEKKNIYILY